MYKRILSCDGYHLFRFSFRPFQAAADKEVEGCVGIASAEDGKEKVIDSIVDNVTWQMGKEAKNTALKQLQGHVYREAYKTGKLFGK